MDMFFKLYEDYSINKLIFRNIDAEKLKNPEYIDIWSISSTGKYLSFKVDQMIIGDNIFNDVLIAVVLKNFQDFDCIINSYMLDGV